MNIALKIGVALALLLAPAAASAQEFPTRPIKLIVPFPPGGPNDIIARAVGQRMGEILGQPIVIENRGGAGGITGTDAVAKAAPDGYTIALTSAGALAISVSMQEKVPYETLKDLKPISLIVKVPEMLVVATNVPAANLQELVALAKSKPGQLSFASSGPGSMPHLAGELFKISAGIDIVHVPYRGAAPAVNDLLAQQVHMVFLDLPVLLPQVQAGKLKAIAVGSRVRAEAAKDVPTTAELGMPQVEAENWYGLVAPAAHAARSRREAEQGRRGGGAQPAGAGAAREPGRASRGRHAGGVRRLYPGRDREMGPGHQAGRRHGELTPEPRP